MGKFVFFDVGGTLIRPQPSVGGVYRRAGLAHGLTASVELLQSSFREAWMNHVGFGLPENQQLKHDEASTRARWRDLIDDVFDRVQFGGNRDNCFNALYEVFAEKQSWQVFDDVIPTLRALDARGIGKGIISNWDARLPSLLDTLGLSTYFSPILVSALVGSEKPSAKIFRLACDRAHVKTKDVIYIGDQYDFDIAPPQRLGMTALLIDRYKKDSSPYAIGSLQEILRQLDDLI